MKEDKKLKTIYPVNFGSSKPHKWRGFTFIELLIVIGILAILTTGVIVVVNPLQQIYKSRDAKRKNDLKELQHALEAYYNDNGRYPANFASSDFRITYNGRPVDWGKSWLPYMNALPVDPSPPKTYVYYSPPASDGQTYFIYASLDRTDDPQACNSSNPCMNIPSGATCGSKSCNYGISSPNVVP